MRNRSILFGFLLIFTSFCVLLGLSAKKHKSSFAATESRAECVVELSSRRILHKKGEASPLPMASTTKILTAILIIDECDLEEEVIVPQSAQGVEGSSVYLKAGDKYSVRDLLYGLMLRSGNDCAETLALHHSGSIAAFAQKMNQKAISLGAERSHFVNPHGLPDKRHYTTACDLAMIASYAMENETFCEIVSCKYYHPHNWKNKNKMLDAYDGALGVKTGFTMSAGRCLVTSAERDGMKLVSVVLNSPQMYERTAQLLDNCYETYHLERIFDCKQGIEGMFAKENFIYPIQSNERDKIQIIVQKNNPFPMEKGEIAGQLQIMLENNLLFSQNLYIM